jgi:hypothetical protein
MRYVLGLLVALLAARVMAAEIPTISVHGTVQSPAGEAIAGAKVVLRGRGPVAFGLQGTDHRGDIIARTETDREGRFRFDKTHTPPRMGRLIDRLQGPSRGNDTGVEVIAWSQGKAVAWKDLTRDLVRGTSDQPVSLVLHPEADVTGVVRNEAGKPLGQADVRLYGLSPGPGHLSSFLDRPGDLNLISSELVFGAASDAEGKFQLSHVPAEHRVVLRARAAEGERTTFVMDTSAKPGAATIQFQGEREEPRPLLRSPVELPLKSQRSIEVQVVDHEGKPVTSGAVLSYRDEMLSSYWPDVVNEAGIAHVPVTNSGKLTLVYDSDARQPRLGNRAQLDVAFDRELPKTKIQLSPPRWLEGKVVDESSGVGLPGATVFYGAEAPDPEQMTGVRSRAISDQQGRFRIPVAIGKGNVSVSGPYFGYYLPKFGLDRAPYTPVEIGDRGDIPEVTLELNGGLVVTGVVRDPTGKPVPNAIIRAISSMHPYYDTSNMSVHSDAEGKYRLSGFSPHVELSVITLHEAGAAYFILPELEKHPAGTERVVSHELNLKTGVTLVGTVTSQGKPAANVPLKVTRSLGGDPRNLFEVGTIWTNADGVYRIPGFEPGTVFQLSFDSESGLDVIEWPYLHQTVVNKGPEMRLQRAELISYRQTLRGIVVDPEGKPVPGATVSAQWLHGDQLRFRGDELANWTKTEGDGSFEIANLPEQPLQLVAYMPQPGGGLIRFATRISPRLNQTDVRIVLDPKLTKDVEDLDRPK